MYVKPTSTKRNPHLMSEPKVDGLPRDGGHKLFTYKEQITHIILESLSSKVTSIG